ncbi:hypothetical protein VNO78_30720 [Psophocarpus tetragonolobus]|uniref:Uncharacterized protein n=1 Tax=Psophocarpus tetragonolobus TaxID=3891 RepID=A0AAN9RX54_PSOTE
MQGQRERVSNVPKMVNIGTCSNISKEGKYCDQNPQRSLVDGPQILYYSTHLPSAGPIENHSPLSFSITVEQTTCTPPFSSCTPSHHQTSHRVRPEPNCARVSSKNDVSSSSVNPISTCLGDNLDSSNMNQIPICSPSAIVAMRGPIEGDPLEVEMNSMQFEMSPQVISVAYIAL